MKLREECETPEERDLVKVFMQMLIILIMLCITLVIVLTIMYTHKYHLL